MRRPLCEVGARGRCARPLRHQGLPGAPGAGDRGCRRTQPAADPPLRRIEGEAVVRNVGGPEQPSDDSLPRCAARVVIAGGLLSADKAMAGGGGRGSWTCSPGAASDILGPGPRPRSSSSWRTWSASRLCGTTACAPAAKPCFRALIAPTAPAHSSLSPGAMLRVSTSVATWRRHLAGDRSPPRWLLVSVPLCVPWRFHWASQSPPSAPDGPSKTSSYTC